MIEEVEGVKLNLEMNMRTWRVRFGGAINNEWQHDN